MNKKIILKLTLSIFLCTILLVKIDALEIANVFKSLNLLYFITALLITPVIYAIRTYRWQLMLNSLGINNEFSTLLKILVIGIFYGLATPGKLGEFARILHIKGEKSKLVSTIMLEKIYDISILLILSFITVILFFRNYDALIIALAGMAVILISIIFVFMNNKFMILLSSLIGIDTNHINNYTESMSRMCKDRKLMLEILFITIIYYVFVYIISCFALYSLGIPYKAIVTVPLLILIGNIPITISGLGLRESVGTICFLALGESAVHGFSFSLIIFIIFTVIPSICGYILSISSIDSTKKRNWSNNKN
jgi:uncharacterized protein (TIRG00374 family)